MRTSPAAGLQNGPSSAKQNATSTTRTCWCCSAKRQTTFNACSPPNIGPTSTSFSSPRSSDVKGLISHETGHHPPQRPRVLTADLLRGLAQDQGPCVGYVYRELERLSD